MIIRVVPDLYERYIKGTEKHSIVQSINAFLCNLTKSVIKGIKCPCDKVYVTTRVIKHIYDKRPAEEFEFLIMNIHSVIKYPDFIYKNKSAKRGTYCFIKEIKNNKYFCSVEIIEKDNIETMEIATFFRVKDDYLKSYELLWKWEGGNLHRSMFDSGLTQPSNTLQ
ncbi:MAG: hypothetical protein PHN69_03385 [Candidatus Pacebacteria bacterium]|nr:hypothetical protein [Candidatus Paceibacterota bacterium]